MARTLPRNSDLAEQLDLLADLLEIEGEQSFRVLAYRRAATRVRESSTPVAQLALEGKAKDLPGIGKTIEEKIVQVVERGEMLALTKHRALVPGEVVLFTRLPGLGPKTARKIWQELGITTLEELRQAAEDERLRRLAGLGVRSEEKILAALSAAPKPVPDEGRRLLGEGLPAVLAVVSVLREHPAAVAVSEAGSVRRGFSVSEYGIKTVETGETFQTGSEEELYAFLGYAYIPPELRENNGELEAARRGELPKLVELSDLRGDLHSHSTWSSDGKNTIEEMARTAIERGYSYLALTDHSHYLREGRLEAQTREIEALNERLAPFRIAKGIEVNIRANGELDVADDLLAEREWVIASLHTAFDKNPTERVLAAMENPHVDCIGHLTARKITRRPPADVAVERVIEKALETGTFLEINSQPDRLDLRDVHARAAAEAGVKLAVSSDGHSVRALAYPELGIAQARRAWMTADQVLNTRPWPEIERL